MSLITGGNATMVPCVTNASASLSVAPTSGGGGGGGSYTPNPVFSTVTTQLDANFGGSASCFGLTINSALGTPATLVAGANGVLNISNGANCAFITNCSNIVNGANPVTISSINVSSINGQAPGGGSGPDLVVSSITVNPSGQITFANDNTLDAQGLEFNIDAAGLSTLNFGISYVNDESGSSSTIGLGNLLIVSAGASFQNLGANKLFLNSGYGSTPGAVLMNDPTAAGTAYVSSLRVSSINGVIPGGGVAAAGISTNQVAAATGTQLFLKGGADATNINIDSGASSVTMNANNTYIGGTLNVTNSTVTSNIVPSGIASAVNIPRAQISTINASAFAGSPITNFFNWTAYGTVQNGFGVYNGKLTGIGGSGGGYNSTFQLAPVVNFTNTNAMTAFVTSANVGAGAINDLAVSCVGVSSVQVTGTVVGTVNDFSFYVAGPADGLF